VAFEREVGAWGSTLTDRLFRFVGVSALFHAVMAWPTYELYGELIRSGRIARGEALPPWVWLVPAGYVITPLAFGFWIGNATYRRKRWPRPLVGRSPAPRAWDHLFAAADLAGWVIIHLKGEAQVRAIAGVWVTSADGKRRSYAAGYPEVQDIYLVDTVHCDDQTGEILVDDAGAPRFRGVSVLVRWDEVHYLEFVEA
jgi:hypothetical protein